MFSCCIHTSHILPFRGLLLLLNIAQNGFCAILDSATRIHEKSMNIDRIISIGMVNLPARTR